MAGGDGPVLLFDGECGLCNGAVDFLLRHDRRARFRFAALQSPAGRRLRAASGVPASADSMVLLEGGRVWLRSEAVLRTAVFLGPPWSWCAALRALPRPLRDRAYDALARARLRLFGRRPCRLPTPAERERFLEA